MAKKIDKDELMNEVLSKRRNSNNIYNDSLDILKSTEAELDRILMENQKNIDNMSKAFGYSDADYNSLKSEIEKDFNVKIETPQTVVVGKASKEVFDQIFLELKDSVSGQESAAKDLTTAFRRPYVMGSDPRKIRNSIMIYGPNGTGRHLLLKNMAQLLKKHGLVVSDEIVTLDMGRYQSQSQESLFLQDLYIALNGKNPIILIENFESSSPIFNRMLGELVTTGSCILNKRYIFANNQLQEATARLAGSVIDAFSGNDKTLVFVSTLKPAKLMDFFGKSVIDAISDRVETVTLSPEALEAIIHQLLRGLDERCTAQLEVETIIDDSLITYLKSCYEPIDGADSLSPIIERIYKELVDVALKEDGFDEITIAYDGSLKATFSGKTVELSLGDATDKERAEIQKELDSIVGLKKVKDYLLSLEDHIRVNQIRKQKGLKTTEVSKHMIFTGNPGTGKTTIARIVSRMMKACGILKQGQLVEVTRADLVGKYVGHTAPLTMDVINSALGGVLFIDEAYSLYRGKDDSFGLEAIDTIVKAMEDHRDDLIVILAGYSKEMAEFLTANSGLKSRFANIIHFDDYTGEEMALIAQSIAKGKDYLIEEEAFKELTAYFTKIQAREDKNSGNGRLARNVVEAAILKQSKRLLSDESAELNLLLKEDFDLKED